jgi:tetratricopeptide (TPR) repeat protein
MAELRTLPGDLADVVARYLVATSLEPEPERAYKYAVAARGLAARVGIVRETAAIAAYQADKWADALTEFRAARRLTGRNSYLPLMADCERALGRLDRALDIVTGPDSRSADRATQVELHIVESGIRRDQGLPDAAVVALQLPELTEKRRGKAANGRLFYAYADALLDAGRDEEAREWFGKAAAADPTGETDAAERVDDLDDVLFEDLDEDWDDSDETSGAPGDASASAGPADADVVANGQAARVAEADADADADHDSDADRADPDDNVQDTDATTPQTRTMRLRPKLTRTTTLTTRTLTARTKARRTLAQRPARPRPCRASA